MTDTVIETRTLNAIHANGVDIVTCFGSGRGVNGREQLSFYLRPDQSTGAIQPICQATLKDAKTIGNGPVLVFDVDYNDSYEFAVRGETVTIIPDRQELELFQDKKVILAIRNGESVARILQWLTYNARVSSVDSVLLLDRADPQVSKKFVQKLAASISETALGISVTVVSCTLPLGQNDVPEWHPYQAPDVPGREKLPDLPQPDPWSAPLNLASIYEVLRRRFLNTALAVVNIDTYDLMRGTSDGDVFQSALSSDTGYISVMCKPCYPWKTKPGVEAEFWDHVCVQFDNPMAFKRWCVVPAKQPANAVWRPNRIGNMTNDQNKIAVAFRYMAIRHRANPDTKLIPKASLIGYDPLKIESQSYWKVKRVFAPPSKVENLRKPKTQKAVIITTMKNEGPFLLEWLAYHRVVGFEDFIVYTNDCTDGTDAYFDLLQSKGLLQHRDNPFKSMGLRPQHAALQAAQDEDVIKDAKWVTCIDVDEFVNISVGAGTLTDLFTAVPNANHISMTWRLFGHGYRHTFEDSFTIGQFDDCAPEYAPRPHQAWGFKTLFQNNGIFRKLGVHRPKGLNSVHWDRIRWVNGSGKAMPPSMYRSAWRSSTDTYGYDLVSLNHYAVRNCESFLVKRDRGRVNHVDRDQGLAYWFRMNNNAVKDRSIMRMIPKLQAEFDRLMADPDIAAMQKSCVEAHKSKIEELKSTENYMNFYNTLKGERMEKLSVLHKHFGRNIFLSGPDVVPDAILSQDLPDDFYFTVEEVKETNH